MKSLRSLLLLLLLTLPALACDFGADGPPRNAEVVNVLANTSLSPWLEEAVTAFNEEELETSAGNPAYVMLTAEDAGQAVTSIQSGATPTLWIPDSQVWVNVLAQEGTTVFQGDCSSVAQSPLVIAMWRELAESLGWPGRNLGWLDVGSLAADPGAWEYYSGGQFGEVLRLGHTHPGLSATGASTLLAIVQAAEAQTEPVDVAEIQQPIVQASVGAFESAVSWFSVDTGTLAQTMRERGASFLGAAVMYESDVLSYGAGDPEIVVVYPFEGTFVADHPACIKSDAQEESREAAALFRDYLLGENGQEMAAAHGLRPVNPAVSPPAGNQAADPNQPERVFGTPPVASLYAAQELWQSARKDVNLIMLIDVSGSMEGTKIENVRRSAVQFVQQMGDDDYLSVITFSTVPHVVISHQQVGANRERMVGALQELRAEGDTALYDAIAEGAALVESTAASETADAVVVLTDGLDTNSFRHNAASAARELNGTGATVFTIAYGNDADEDLLEQIALDANGSFFLGDEASIASIYQEMSAAFGGSLGVGR